MLYEHQGLGCRRLCRHVAPGGNRYVTLLEPPGSEIMVHSAIDAPTIGSGDPDALDVALVQGQPNAVGRFNPRSRVRKGEVVEIDVASENLHFFDPQTRSALTEVS